MNAIIFALHTGLQKNIKTPIDVKVKDLLLTFVRAEKIDIKYLRERIAFLFNDFNFKRDNFCQLNNI